MDEDGVITSRSPTPILHNAVRRVADPLGLNRNLSPNSEIELGPIASNMNVPSNLAVENTPQSADSVHRGSPQHTIVAQLEDAQSVTGHQNHPLTIAPEKIEKALELYNVYWLELLLETTATSHGDGYLISSSNTESEQPRTAIRDPISAASDLFSQSSVISLDDKDTGSISYDGRRVTTRRRKRLSPSARAEAALVRYLGSCSDCRRRRVPCPLDHHDIASLEKLRLAPTRGEREERATTSAFDWVDPDTPTQRSYNVNNERAENTSAATSSQQQISSPTRRDVDGGTAGIFVPNPTTPANTTGCNLCMTLYILWFVIVAGSLAVGLWRSIVTSDEGKGFTDAAYVVAVGGVILYPVQNRHAKRCKAAND